jgi:hypothetical protein
MVHCLDYILHTLLHAKDVAPGNARVVYLEHSMWKTEAVKGEKWAEYIASTALTISRVRDCRLWNKHCH